MILNRKYCDLTNAFIIQGFSAIKGLSKNYRAVIAPIQNLFTLTSLGTGSSLVVISDNIHLFWTKIGLYVPKL